MNSFFQTEPMNEIIFKYLKLSNVIADLKIKNTSKMKIVFRIKSSQISKYIIIPTFSMLDPNEERNIKFLLRTNKQTINERLNDEIEIEAIPFHKEALNFSVSNSNDFWKEKNQNNLPLPKEIKIFNICFFDIENQIFYRKEISIISKDKSLHEIQNKSLDFKNQILNNISYDKKSEKNDQNKNNMKENENNILINENNILINEKNILINENQINTIQNNDLLLNEQLINQINNEFNTPKNEFDNNFNNYLEFNDRDEKIIKEEDFFMDIESSEENKNKKEEEIDLFHTSSNDKQNEELINKNDFFLEKNQNKFDIFNDNNHKNEYNNKNNNDFFLNENPFSKSNDIQNKKKEKKNLNLQLNINPEILEIRKKISELAELEESSQDEKSFNKSEKLLENKTADRRYTSEFGGNKETSIIKNQSNNQSKFFKDQDKEKLESNKFYQKKPSLKNSDLEELELLQTKSFSSKNKFSSNLPQIQNQTSVKIVSFQDCNNNKEKTKKSQSLLKSTSIRNFDSNNLDIEEDSAQKLKSAFISDHLDNTIRYDKEIPLMKKHLVSLKSEIKKTEADKIEKEEELKKIKFLNKFLNSQVSKADLARAPMKVSLSKSITICLLSLFIGSIISFYFDLSLERLLNIDN